MAGLRNQAIGELIEGSYSITSRGVNLLDGQKMPTELQITAKIKELESSIPFILLREKRDNLLIETDWWGVSDRAMTDKQTAYRKALRDLPETESPEIDENASLTGVTWPTKPTE